VGAVPRPTAALVPARLAVVMGGVARASAVMFASMLDAAAV
jgi:hypothetical protein